MIIKLNVIKELVKFFCQNLIVLNAHSLSIRTRDSLINFVYKWLSGPNLYRSSRTENAAREVTLNLKSYKFVNGFETEDIVMCLFLSRSFSSWRSVEIVAEIIRLFLISRKL